MNDSDVCTERRFRDDLEIGTETIQPDDLAASIQSRRNSPKHEQSTNSLIPLTPLTGPQYLAEKDTSYNITPVSTATQSVSNLLALLSNMTTPSDCLLDIFKLCKKNPCDEILARVEEMGCTFSALYTEPSTESRVDFAKKRLQLGKSLYFKVLENILISEKKRLPANYNFNILLDQEYLHRALFACCLEIVIFSYNSKSTFPWIIEVFNLDPYYFYKVIEPIIRILNNRISRDVVKHLIQVEEEILEKLAWKNESPLWKQIKNSEIPIQEDANQSESVQSSPLLFSPIYHPTVRCLTNIEQPVQIPGQSSFAPPVTSSSLSLFWRKFWNLAMIRMNDLCDKLKITDKTLRHNMWGCFQHSIVFHSDLMMDRHLDQMIMCAIMAKILDKDEKFQEIIECYRMQPQAASHVYQSVLLRSKKKRSNNESKAGAFRSNLPILLERDGDRELLMIHSSSTLLECDPTSQLPTSPRLSGTSSSFDCENRGDLIEFYKTIYVPKLQSKFKFSAVRESVESSSLSPMPVLISYPTSPRRRVNNSLNVYISPLKTSLIIRPLSKLGRRKLNYKDENPNKISCFNDLVRISNDRIEDSNNHEVS